MITNNRYFSVLTLTAAKCPAFPSANRYRQYIKMKTILTIFLISFHFVGLSQFSSEKVLYNYKGGLIFKYKKLVIPKDNHFILEQYEYGGGVFTSNPYRDTLKLQFDTLVGKEVKFFKDGKNYYEIYKNHKKHWTKPVWIWNKPPPAVSVILTLIFTRNRKHKNPSF